MKLTRKTWLLSVLAIAFTGLVGHAQALNDNQIADIMKTANDAEIDAGQLAKKKAANAEVKSFAEHMVVTHKQSNKDGKDLAKKIDVKTDGNDVSKSIKQSAKNSMSDLKKAKGAEFDKAYINQQVSVHQQLLNDLDQKFIPAAQNPQFKEWLQTTRGHVQDHLAKAQALQTTLTK